VDRLRRTSPRPARIHRRRFQRRNGSVLVTGGLRSPLDRFPRWPSVLQDRGPLSVPHTPFFSAPPHPLPGVQVQRVSASDSRSLAGTASPDRWLPAPNRRTRVGRLMTAALGPSLAPVYTYAGTVALSNVLCRDPCGNRNRRGVRNLWNESRQDRAFCSSRATARPPWHDRRRRAA
jgi:hypothetical protein